MITVRVKVTRIVQEFVISLYGGKTILCEQNDTIANKIKGIVARSPKGYELPIETESDHYVDFEVKNIAIGRLKKSNYRAVIRKDAISNNYISDVLQHELNKDLKSLFKDIFTAYVFAFVRGRKFKKGSQKEAILDFCDVYCITCQKLEFDSLKKTWQRSSLYNKAKDLYKAKI